MDPLGILIDPLEKQRATAALMRSPALGMPSAGVETPKPATADLQAPEVGVTGNTTQSYKTLQQINERMNAQPDPAQLVGLAQERGDRSNRNMLLGLALQAKGGERLGGAGGQILQRALADSGDYEIPGGWGTISRDGKVAWNPAKQQEADLARLTTLYGIQERGERADEAAQQRSEDVRYRTDALAQAAKDRAAQQAQAAEDRAAGRKDAADAKAEQQRWRGEDNMRNHFDSITKDTRDVLNTARYVKQLPPDGKLNAVQQQSLIILLNKFQDPGSVVREGEFDRVAAAQALLAKWGNLPNKFMTGEPLPPAMVRDIQAAINDFTTAAENTMYDTASDYLRTANSRGYDPDQVVTDLRWHSRGGQRPGGGAAPGAGGAPAAAGGGGRGTHDSPIEVKPRAPAAPERRKQDTIKVPY